MERSANRGRDGRARFVRPEGLGRERIAPPGG